MISPELARIVRTRAKGICEFCLSPEEGSHLKFHIEHIRPKAHGGQGEAENLAVACPECNWHKSVNLTGIDPDSDQITPLFNPRRDQWREHFEIHEGRIAARTAEGRTTLWLLRMNDPKRITARLRKVKPSQ